jgi:hypothetical protein
LSHWYAPFLHPPPGSAGTHFKTPPSGGLFGAKTVAQRHFQCSCAGTIPAWRRVQRGFLGAMRMVCASMVTLNRDRKLNPSKPSA